MHLFAHHKKVTSVHTADASQLQQEVKIQATSCLNMCKISIKYNKGNNHSNVVKEIKTFSAITFGT